MARSIRDNIRRRRTQRWLKREALLLAQEAEAFGCPEMRREASRLLDMTAFAGSPALHMA